jgi:TonB family protein
MIAPTTDNLVAITIQAAALAIAGAPLPWLFRVRSPGARLAYWRALLLACLLLPAVQPWVPQTLQPDSARGGGTEQTTALAVADAGSSEVRPAGPVFPRVELLDLVAAGIGVRACWFLAGLIALARVRRRAVRLDPPPGTVVDAIGLARADAEFRLAPTPTRPVTFGLFRPVVVVPSDFAAFPEEEQKAIACHELVHVRRHDWLRNLGDEVVRAVAWFHPAAWWLTRQIRLAREEVVDQEVVRQLGSRKSYLDALLRLASPDRGSVFVPAPLFLGRSHLADRVALLLKEVRMSRPRLVLSFVVMAAVLFATGRAVAGAFPLQAAGQAAVGTERPGQPARQPASPAKKVATGVTKTKDVSPAFPVGSAPAPVVVSGHINPSGDVADISCAAGPVELCDVAMSAVKQWRFSPSAGTALLVGFNPAATSGVLAGQPPVLVGGNVQAPQKILDKKPVYPAEAQEARVQGVVILAARIAVDGQVSEVRILRSIPKLDMAALEAVLGWKFQQQGFPVEMTVTVNFVLDGDKPAGVKGGVPGGTKGGVEGGVAGGVPGGVGGGASGGVAGAEGQSPKWVALSSGEKALRVGGVIKPPQRIVDVKPVYPQDAKDAKVQGVVVMEAVIGPDGKVKEAKVLRSVPMLDQAALDAVRQWEFAPTLLNGVAQTMIMTVTVNFTLQ